MKSNVYEELSNLKISDVAKVSRKIDKFGKNTFNNSAMQRFLSAECIKKFNSIISQGGCFTPEVLKDFSAGLLNWALENGATHYSHWFQPLTGSVAEKHDAFLDLNCLNNEAIEKFTYNELIKQEPDASSFPHGAIRSTFEARGYTAWDPSSPIFLFGSTMCIPAMFISHTGLALDNKIPLLKAESLFNSIATKVVKIFDQDVNSVYTTLGWEQEYFALKYKNRLDLDICNRTLVGVCAAKGQKMNDHYFGSIQSTVLEYMKQVEDECVLVGLPIKTRHNEVAPNQYEFAHVYEKVNVAVDHNYLLKDIMLKVARKKNLRVLFHEKPFFGINGSGKHSNFSFLTDTNVNLLSSGETFEEKLRFLTFIVNIIKAVYDYEPLIKSAAASAGNDLRLGGNEAPPAIISIYLGDEVTSVLQKLKNSTEVFDGENKSPTYFKIVEKVPEIFKEKNDRNRTSPFAFIGNKFEFRALGSDQCCSKLMTTLIAAISNQLKNFLDEYNREIKSGKEKTSVILNILKGYLLSSEKILFEGNGYSKEWFLEAEKRGLNCLKGTPLILKDKISEKSIQLFTSLKIFTEEEIKARYNIELENYIKTLEIESRIIKELVLQYIIPSSIKYHTKINQDMALSKSNSNEITNLIYQNEISEKIGFHLTQLYGLIKKINCSISKYESISQLEEKAMVVLKELCPLMEQIRNESNELEIIVAAEDWNLSKYSQMLRPFK